MGFGVFLMLVGFISIFIGFGIETYTAVLIGLSFLLLAALFMLSIDCIAYDKDLHQLRLYKDYLITTKGEWISLNDYSSVAIYYQVDLAIQRNLNNIQYKTYEVHLTSDKNNNSSIADYGDLNAARDLQELISKKTGLIYIDEPVRILPKSTYF